MKHLLSDFIFIVFIFTSCAVPGTLNGGDEDDIAPQLVPELSTPSMQTNFKKREIKLTFDEWVKIGKPQSIIISPPLRYKPQLSIKKKTLILKLDDRDTLADDVTYSIQFGEAIQDITKGNAAKGIDFVFSTGSFIDSLSLNGSVKLLNKEGKQALPDVLLYKEGVDSLVYTQPPIYRVKADNSGFFKFNYLKEGMYNIYALIDNNKNGYYDRGETFGFLDTVISLPINTGSIPTIRLYESLQEVKLLDENYDVKGRDILTFSKPLDSLNWQILPKPNKVIPRQEEEQLTFWHDIPDSISYKIIIEGFDTIKVRKHKRVIRKPQKSQFKSVDCNPFMPKKMGFEWPIRYIDSSKVTFVLDSTDAMIIPVLKLDTLDPQNVEVMNDLTSKSTWKLMFEAGSIVDFWGETNVDTLYQTLNVKSKEDFGNIVVNYDSLKVKVPFIICRLKQKETVLNEKIIDLNSKEISYQILHIEGGKYQLELVLDKNGNKKWDTGNYKQRQQPEDIILSSEISLRKGWDIDVKLADILNQEVPNTFQPNVGNKDTKERPNILNKQKRIQHEN